MNKKLKYKKKNKNSLNFLKFFSSYSFQLSDEQTLQKRITMAENRIQDLEWLLRDKQLSEK